MHPDPDAVRLQLGRILASDLFVSSDRLSRFLRYVVERALAGEGDRLKEYVIGAEVFDRGEQYDPRVDSIVRVEAGRLRAKVDEYYNRQGAADAVIIRMRRGSYTPLFEQRQPPSPAPLPPEGPAVAAVGKPARSKVRMAMFAALVLVAVAVAAWRADLWTAAGIQTPGITIAVLPFASYSTDEAERLLAARVTDGVTSELARIGTVGVVSHTSALQFATVRRPLRDVAQALNADVIMEASLLMEGDRVRADVRLVDADLDRKFWVEDFVGKATEVRELQHRIATAVAAAASKPRRRSSDERMP